MVKKTVAEMKKILLAIGSRWLFTCRELIRGMKENFVDQGRVLVGHLRVVNKCNWVIDRARIWLCGLEVRVYAKKFWARRRYV